MAKKKTRRDVAEIARANLEQIIGEKLNGEPLEKPEPPQPPTARQAAGRLGGLKGGRTRAKRLSSEQRSAVARKAAKERWGQAKKAKSGLKKKGVRRILDS